LTIEGKESQAEVVNLREIENEETEITKAASKRVRN
jgi:hypothetical protein